VARGTARTDVAVMGAGSQGSAAIGFARRGRRVLVLERDSTAPAGDDPDAVFDAWERAGVAQFRQPHNFLGLVGGRSATRRPTCSSGSLRAVRSRIASTSRSPTAGSRATRSSSRAVCGGRCSRMSAG